MWLIEKCLRNIWARWARNMARNIEREMFDEDENERFEGHFEIQIQAPHFYNSIFLMFRIKKNLYLKRKYW
jgi:hypothetical protein